MMNAVKASMMTAVKALMMTAVKASIMTVVKALMMNAVKASMMTAVKASMLIALRFHYYYSLMITAERNTNDFKQQEALMNTTAKILKVSPNEDFSKKP